MQLYLLLVLGLFCVVLAAVPMPSPDFDELLFGKLRCIVDKTDHFAFHSVEEAMACSYCVRITVFENCTVVADWGNIRTQICQPPKEQPTGPGPY